MPYPKSREEAEHFEYGRDDPPYYRPLPYDPKRCAMECGERPWYIHSHQCSRRPGHGPEGLFCRQHAARVEYLLDIRQQENAEENPHAI